MPTLKEFAATFKGKRELSDLESIPVNISLNTGEFDSANGKKVSFNYIEVDGWKYTIKGDLMSQIKAMTTARPLTKNFRVMRSPGGEEMVVPLD